MSLVPPNSIEAEQGLLCSMLIDHNVISAAMREGVRTAAFFHPPHRTIWDLLTEMDGAGQPIDFVTFTQRLRDAGQLENVGGPAGVSCLQTFTPTMANWKQYAKTLIEKARRRALQAAADRLREIAGNENEEMAQVEEVAQGIGLESARAMVEGSAVQHVKVPVLEFLDQVEKAQTGTDTRPRLEIGLPYFEKLTHGLPPGTMMTLGAQTSVGKTAFALQAAWGVAAHSISPRSVLFVSLEMSARTLAGRIIAYTSNVALGKLHARKPELSQGDFQDIHRAILKVGMCELYFNAPQITPTASQIAALMRIQKMQRPDLALVVVDYLQLMAPANIRDSRERQVAEMSDTLTRAAVSLDITVIALSQLNEFGQLRESRAIGHNSAIVARLTRPEIDPDDEDAADTGERTLHLDKNREGQSLISIPLHFDAEHMHFHEKLKDKKK